MNDKVIMPRALTAANGGKWLMLREFETSISVYCNRCNGTGQDGGVECYVCDGTGEEHRTQPIPWTTIKEIYKLAVKHFGEEVK